MHKTNPDVSNDFDDFDIKESDLISFFVLLIQKGPNLFIKKTMDKLAYGQMGYQYIKTSKIVLK